MCQLDFFTHSSYNINHFICLFIYHNILTSYLILSFLLLFVFCNSSVVLIFFDTSNTISCLITFITNAILPYLAKKPFLFWMIFSGKIKNHPFLNDFCINLFYKSSNRFVIGAVKVQLTNYNALFLKILYSNICMISIVIKLYFFRKIEEF